MVTVKTYKKDYYNDVIQFLQKCLPESGRNLDLQEHHKIYCDIEHSFEEFWCMFEENKIIGTVALRRLDCQRCELKSLYLLEEYQGKGLGYTLLQTAITQAQNAGYEIMFLDSLSSSKKAISLYRRAGFVVTERYNNNYAADIFMMLSLQ